MDRDVAARESAAPAAPGNFEAEADVVVVGGGGGGLPAALFSRWLVNEVIRPRSPFRQNGHVTW